MQGEKHQKVQSGNEIRQNEKRETEENLMKEEKTQTSQSQRKFSEQKEPNLPKEDRPPHPCPICGQMSQKSSYPFCSTRCRAVDLNRWLSGAYILPPPTQVSDEEE
ncbi:DNA gyrase inhibitor YacG [Bartonella queenslandensis]|uniref:DNA gyrase inhibitor YacG n=1 Tax=Bartonella queenslandensis TaxID=481138 RepID=UPI001BA4C9F3|nr:DNA gyrase inhibitor YacG [Bartonella queenslandensis]